MQNKNIVTKNVIYGITGLTLLILAISLGTQTPSSAQIPPGMNGTNNNTTIFENNVYQTHNYVKQVAKDILEKYGEFQLVFFLMPNGDIYIEEPYSLQQNLSKSNFAFRDYYKGVITNNDTFLGNVIVGASSGKNQAVMAVPIYFGANGSLTGIWAGGLNMSEFNKSLQLLNLTNNERIAYVDNLGQKVADSDVNKSMTPESVAILQSFKNAKN